MNLDEFARRGVAAQSAVDAACRSFRAPVPVDPIVPVPVVRPVPAYRVREYTGPGALCEMCGLTEATAARLVMRESRAVCASCAAYVDRKSEGNS